MVRIQHISKGYIGVFNLLCSIHIHVAVLEVMARIPLRISCAFFLHYPLEERAYNVCGCTRMALVHSCCILSSSQRACIYSVVMPVVAVARAVIFLRLACTRTYGRGLSGC